MKDYTTVGGLFSTESVVRGSRFIGVSMPCPDEASVRDGLAAVAAMYPGATHYCYAALFGDSERFSDNGEPSGTAGRPILSVLRGSGLSDVLVVVVRYFGGTLLGTGGLVKAYTASAEAAVAGATPRVRRACAVFDMTLDYSTYSVFESRMSGMMARRPRCEYSDRVDVRAWVPLDMADGFLAAMTSLTGGRTLVARRGDEHVRPKHQLSEGPTGPPC